MSTRGDDRTMTATLGTRAALRPRHAASLAWAIPLGALAFAVLVWPFPAPVGVIVNGALVGGRVALIALGIALVYRANRVINFAAGDLGQLPASLAVLLVLSLGLELRRSARCSASSRRSCSASSSRR